MSRRLKVVGLNRTTWREQWRIKIGEHPVLKRGDVIPQPNTITCRPYNFSRITEVLNARARCEVIGYIEIR